MSDALPWIVISVVLAGAIGYVLGRRSVRSPAGSGAAPAVNAATAASSREDSDMKARRTLGSVPAAEATRAQPPAVSTPSGLLAKAASWGYQLQDIDVEAAAASAFDLLVLDRTRDGSEATALTPADLSRLKTKPDGGHRLVYAYCSVGEAESYRSYWRKEWAKNKPDWLLGENPDWEENYSVCFWEPAWQALICGSPAAELDRIVAQGFDGIYLDKCDVTEDLRRHFRSVARSRQDLDGDMVAFMRRISDYARSKKPEFGIVMQNAETLLERPEVRALVDGVAKEELIFGVDGPEKPNERDEFEDSRRRLDMARADGKPVFVVEYLANPAKIAEARKRAIECGYVLYVAPKNRELDRLNVAASAGRTT